MIFTIKTDDEVAGLDITKALLQAGIKHTILSKQNDEATEQSVYPTKGNLCAICGRPEYSHSPEGHDFRPAIRG